MKEKMEELKRKAEVGDIDAQIKYAWNLCKKKLYKESFYWYSQAAPFTDEPYVFLGLSYRYIDGMGVKQDYKKAFHYAQMAFRLDYIRTITLLGWFHLNGIVTPTNFAFAKRYYEMAFNLDPNDRAAVFSLGNIAYIEKDYEKAYDYFIKVYTDIEPTHIGTNYFLGRLLAEKKCLAYDLKKGERMVNYVAKKGHPLAKHLLKSQYWKKLKVKTEKMCDV